MTLASLQTLASTDEGRERIRVMVAELQGYYSIKRYSVLSGDRINALRGRNLKWGSGRRLQNRSNIPSYTESLDACAEFEAGLTDKEQRMYASNLAGLHNCKLLIYHDCATAYAEKLAFVLLSASALHRCMAFILTKTKGAE